uniref:Uncharacterized protein n=1 Tax=Stegastes partitus TaxID=144197 RepID=A0A3B5ASY7_9TELE
MAFTPLVWMLINILLPFNAGTCDKYSNITEPWRNKLYTSTSFTGFPKGDEHLVGKWWRFTGIGGDRIITACLTGNRAGGHYTTHFAFTYPTNESETVEEGTAYGDVASCSQYSIPMQVVLCPGGFYIYKPTRQPHSYLVHATCKPLIRLPAEQPERDSQLR